MITDTVVIEESFLANMTLQKDTGFFLKNTFKKLFLKVPENEIELDQFFIITQIINIFVIIMLGTFCPLSFHYR